MTITAETRQQWIALAEQLTKDARDASESGKLDRIQSAINNCADFIAQRLPACPPEVTHAVADVQVELSQLIVAGKVIIIGDRTAQFTAYLQDIQRISKAAENAADLISFSTAREVVGDVTEIIKDIKAVKQQIEAGKTDGVAAKFKEITDGLQKVVADFDGLKPD